MLVLPFDHDLSCPNCGYNLRGLWGDPLRCPECGHVYAREYLLREFGLPARRFKDLRQALDALTTGLLAFCGLLAPWICGVVLLRNAVVLSVAVHLAVVGVLLVVVTTILGPVRQIRRMSGGPEWVRPLVLYQLVTIGRAAVIGGAGLVQIGVAVFLSTVVHWPAELVIAGILATVVSTVAIFIMVQPVARLRCRQEDYFKQLIRLTGAGSVPPDDGNLLPAVRTDSLTAMKHDSLQRLLSQHFAAAIAQVSGGSVDQTDPQVRPAGDPKFGDYQCNVAMSLARPLKAKPREIAERIKAAVEPRLADVAEPLEIAGPGFINIRLKDAFLAKYLADVPPPPSEISNLKSQILRPEADADRVGLAPVERPERVVIDYSQPNIAKQMHVGHLRTTIIGDVLVRVLAFEGHEVIRQNHIGDWGTQFGMLIRWYRENPLPTPQTHSDVLDAIETDYKAANERFGRDEQFAAEARRAVAELQGGDPAALRVWEQIRDISLAAVQEIYDRLGVLLTPEDVVGESFYNTWLADVVAEMRRRLPPGGDGGVLPGVRAEVRDDAGAVCVFMYDDKGAPLFTTKDGSALPMIIQKSDGGYNYDTTDLAAIRYRVDTLKARRILYVVDAGQTPHFQMLFAAAGAAGFIPPDVQVMHVKFGMMLGAGGTRIKTREGGTIRLRELLDEAEQRAYGLVESREGTKEGEELETARFSEDEKRLIARRIGIASVKYADLRNDRTSNYVFDWDKMISFQGNTAPYMLYAYGRIRSIYRKAAERFGSPDVYGPGVHLTLAHPAERTLALCLARLREAIDNVAADLTPHTLCTYLYDLAAEFMRFYELCPVLQAPDEAARLSRMRLCDLTARTLKLGLGLLGIDVLERM